MKVLVLDTSAFIMGFNPMSVETQTYSVLSVEEELQRDSMAMTRLRTARDSGKLIVKEPAATVRQQVERAAQGAGDNLILSRADRDILALALGLQSNGNDPVIVSDDYAVQNVAESLRIGFRSLATFGITHKFDWIYYCPGCHRKYAQVREGECEVCGTKLRRKVLSKKPVVSKI